MKTIIILISFLNLFVLIAFAQDISVYEQTNEKGDVLIYADCSFSCPMTLTINCELENLTPNEKLPFTKVILPNQNKQILIKLEPVPGKAYGYGFEYEYFYGDHTDTTYHRSYAYWLPYEENKSFKMTQGYNGPFSHQNKRCLDFDMPLKTKICAAREGVVVMVKEDSNKGCANISCAEDGNHIVIYHEDGTFAEYFHLTYKGSMVKIGQKVAKGEHIGFCGNTGWSQSSHLHFAVYLPNSKIINYVPTKFLLGPNKIELLIEGEEYTAIHQ